MLKIPELSGVAWFETGLDIDKPAVWAACNSGIMNYVPLVWVSFILEVHLHPGVPVRRVVPPAERVRYDEDTRLRRLVHGLAVDRVSLVVKNQMFVDN